MSVLPEPSDEQIEIIIASTENFNIIVDAVAGSGKTTTILHIAQANPDKRILLLTYNKRLKDETRKRAAQYNILNIEIHSYHAFCVKYYNKHAHTDTGIIYTIENDQRPIRPPMFNLIILDEVQDMTELYFNLVIKLIRDNIPPNNTIDFDNYDNINSDDIGIDSNNIDTIENDINSDDIGIDSDNIGIDSDIIRIDSDRFGFDEITTVVELDVGDFDLFEMDKPEKSDKPDKPDKINVMNVQVCLFGDVWQNIYAFKNADDRYLSMADKILPVSGPWKHMKMSKSFRVTKQIAQFVNEICLHENRIRTDRVGSKVSYLRCDAFSATPLRYIKECLKTYKPGDIFIIGPTVRKQKGPLSRIENKLVALGIPCFVPSGDDEMLNESQIQGKVVFSTIHQVKGLERRVVVIFNFDMTYFTFYNRTANPNRCPNEIYVALTRSLDKLYLIHHYKNDYMPFLDKKSIPKLCHFYGEINKQNIQPTKIYDSTMLQVADITRHLPSDVITVALNMLKWKQVNLNSLVTIVNPITLDKPINIPISVDGTAGSENVSDINGVCIPSLFEMQRTGKISIVEQLKFKKKQLPLLYQKDITNLIKKYNSKQLKLQDLLYLSNLYISMRSGYNFKIAQIVKYNWLLAEPAAKALKVIKKYVSPTAEFEHMITKSILIDGISREISGSIDAIDKQTPLALDAVCVWEFKCVSELNPEHILQLAFYAWMYNGTKPVKFYIINILRDDIIEIDSNSSFEEVVIYLLKYKLSTTTRIDDKTFISRNKSI